MRIKRVRATAKVLHPQSRELQATNLSTVVCENKFTWNWTSCNWFRVGPARRIMFANYWRCSLVEICCCWRCLFSGFLSFRRREDEMKEDFMKLKFQLSTSFESSLHGAAVSSRTSDRGRFSPKTSLHQYFYCFPKATWKLINILFVYRIGDDDESAVDDLNSLNASASKIINHIPSAIDATKRWEIVAWESRVIGGRMKVTLPSTLKHLIMLCINSPSLLANTNIISPTNVKILK